MIEERRATEGGEAERFVCRDSGCQGSPATCHLLKGRHLFWPIVKRGRIEVRAVWPYHCMHLGVEPHLPEKHRVTEWSEEFTRQHGAKIDHPGEAVVKRDPKAALS